MALAHTLRQLLWREEADRLILETERAAAEAVARKAEEKTREAVDANNRHRL